MATLVKGNPGLELVFEAENGLQICEFLKENCPEVLVMDLREGTSIDIALVQCARQLQSKLKILVISDDHSRETIFGAIDNGALSFLTKHCSEEEIIGAIRATSKGDKFFCNSILNVILEKQLNTEEENCQPSLLSEREIEIVRLIAEGYSAKEIADQLFLSPHTVYTHRKNIMKKMRFRSASELVRYAVEEGIIST